MLGMTIPCFEIHNLPFLKAVAAIHARTINKHTLITYSCSRNDGLDTNRNVQVFIGPNNNDNCSNCCSNNHNPVLFILKKKKKS